MTEPVNEIQDRQRDLRQVAERFKSWAAEEGILTFTPPDDKYEDRHEDLDDLATVNQSATASSILSHRRINLVGINAARDEIVVVTHQKLTKKELESLPVTSEGGHKFRYLKSHPPQVRLPHSGGVSAAAHAIHSGRYTCGSSISVANCISAGTLGALVTNAEGQVFALTNNHVSGGCSYTDVNFPIVAPGLLDVRPNGHDPFTLGHHATVAPWTSGIPDNVDVSANIDAAIFRLKDADVVSSMQRGAYDTPTNTMAPVPGLTVRKIGRTTGDTTGSIVAQAVGFVPVTMEVPQFRGIIYFDNVYMIQGSGGQPFSDRGDSGSLVVHQDANGETHAVGLLFAGTGDQQLTFILPIDKILEYFNVTLMGGHHI